MSENKPVAAWQQRVIDEYRELNDRTEKLLAFFKTPIFVDLDYDEQERMEMQYQVMSVYRTILMQRIRAMGFDV